MTAPVWWCCLACDLVGDTDRSAELHTKRTQHTTMTGVDPAVLARLRETCARGVESFLPNTDRTAKAGPR